ncbi:MAG TPA: NAD(P)-dependent oxidoreductase [Candidatus Saccharimonadales bacterium]|nr:NAD(P)-dependent oxidoreductase [Candidatus Saccharimonadales bacterium]
MSRQTAKGTILVTDTLFIFPEHEAALRAAGFKVERLTKAHPSEAELIAALKGKAGYIIGGEEAVTTTVANSLDPAMKAIAFTGADWAHFIPGHTAITQRGIAITNTPGTTTFAVAEFTLTLILIMQRHIFELGGLGHAKFMTVPSLADVRVGIVGIGRIGERVTRLLLGLGVGEVVYWNRTRKPQLETELGIAYVSLEELCKTCDIISNHTSTQAGTVITRELLNVTKNSVLCINTGGRDGFDLDALYERIANQQARAAYDVGGGMHEKRFEQLPLASWYSTNTNAGFNTRTMLESTSDMAVQSVINVLTTGSDQFVVNGVTPTV